MESQLSNARTNMEEHNSKPVSNLRDETDSSSTSSSRDFDYYDDDFEESVYHEKQNVQQFPQSLSYFFTEEEAQMMTPPDSVLSVKGRHYVVIPNAGTRGNTLFHCLGQVISGRESTHVQLREDIVNYICTQDGWATFGQQVVSFYKKNIPVFRSATMTRLNGNEQLETFQKKIYRHYFLNKEIDGSLIELVAASTLYKFNYTCLLLQENEIEPTTCLVLRSLDDELLESATNVKESERKVTREMCYFVRIGESQEEWRWTLAVPYFNNYNENAMQDQPCQFKNIAKGNFSVDCWNVYGLNWTRGNFSVKRSPQHNFSWENGTSVIATASGKFLGGYMNLGKDLFSNLCYMLPNCLHKGRRCLLKDIIRYCPKKLCYSSFADPAPFVDFIIKNKLRMKKSKKKKKRKENVNGTLKDLYRASKIFNFGYYVIEINEHGELQAVRQRYKDTILYVIARTSGKQIVEWLALGDMTALKVNLLTTDINEDQKDIQIPESKTVPNRANCQNARKKSKSNDSWIRNKFNPLVRASISIRYLSSLLLFRGKTRQSTPHKVSPYTDNGNGK